MKTLDLAPRAPETRGIRQPANEPPVKAANEDSPAAGALYRLIARRPLEAHSRRWPLWRACSASGAAGGLPLGAFTARRGLSRLTPNEIVLIGLGMSLPVILVWLVAYTIWRGQEMKFMAEALARTAASRLTDPATRRPASERDRHHLAGRAPRTRRDEGGD